MRLQDLFKVMEAQGPDLEKPARYRQPSLDEVRIDNINGLGAVPKNAEVGYSGLRVQMRPSMFLKLAAPLNLEKPEERQTIEYFKTVMDEKGFGSPFLTIEVPEAWEEGDFSRDAKVRSHEGRHRCIAILEKEGDDPIEMHIFIPHARRRHITDDMIEHLRSGILNQKGRFISGPLFGEAK